jgi:hypothetical protein
LKDEEMARNVTIIPEDAYHALDCVKPSAMREVFVEVPNVGILRIQSLFHYLNVFTEGSLDGYWRSRRVKAETSASRGMATTLPRSF